MYLVPTDFYGVWIIEDTEAILPSDLGSYVGGVGWIGRRSDEEGIIEWYPLEATLGDKFEGVASADGGLFEPLEGQNLIAVQEVV